MIHPQTSLVGRVLDGQFEIIRLLGAGGMGEVYLARQAQTNLPRAVKVIRSAYGNAAAIEKRLKREAMVLSELQHPNIVQVIQLGRTETGDLYLAMEYLEGPTLQEVVDTEGPFSVADTLEILAQIVDALGYAHAKDIVHRDLKPENIILRDGALGSLKIFDFGLAKLLSAEGLTQLTNDGELFGTPAYMSPEQCETTTVTGAADIYALGGIAYFLLSARPPFAGNCVTAFIAAHLNTPPEPIDQRCPQASIPPDLRNLLLSCLAKRPEERPTAEDLEARLAPLRWAARQQERQARGPTPARPKASLSPTGDVPDAAQEAVAPTLAFGSDLQEQGARAGQAATAATVAFESDRVEQGARAGQAATAATVAFESDRVEQGWAPTGQGATLPLGSDLPEQGAPASQAAHAPLDTVHAVAQMIWVDQQEQFENVSQLSGEWAQQEGLSNQITTATLELAEDLSEEPGAPPALSALLQQVEEQEARLTDVGVDLALAESQMNEIQGREAQVSDAMEIQANYRRLNAQITRLRRGLNRLYRELYAALMGFRPQVTDPELIGYYNELAELVQRYLRYSRLSLG